MKIELFVAQSEGTWRSMRTSHSLAFQQFEEVLGQIKIKRLELHREEVTKLIANTEFKSDSIVSPFLIEWETDLDWSQNSLEDNNFGSSTLIPIPKSDKEGLILRSHGYIEKVSVISNYHFLSDESLLIKTQYQNSLTEERIWFVSENVRCRTAVIRTSQGKGVIQTSFASEVRRLNLKEKYERNND